MHPQFVWRSNTSNLSGKTLSTRSSEKHLFTPHTSIRTIETCQSILRCDPVKTCSTLILLSVLNLHICQVKDHKIETYQFTLSYWVDQCNIWYRWTRKWLNMSFSIRPWKILILLRWVLESVSIRFPASDPMINETQRLECDWLSTCR